MLLRQTILLETTPGIWLPLPKWENILANIVNPEKDLGVRHYVERGQSGLQNIGKKSKRNLECDN